MRKIIFLGIVLLLNTINGQVELTSSNLPIMIINTNGQSIIDTAKIVADMGIIYNGDGVRNNVTDSYNDYNGKIGIELRGTTSQFFPKKPYGIELRDSQDEDLSAELLNMPEEEDWVLHNPYSDKTFMRNVVAYKLSNDIGMYGSRTRFVELVLNDQYQGVYVLMEKIKRDKNRVDISKLTADEIEGDDLTGGYIIKLDKTSGEQVGGWQSGNVFYQYHYPKPDDIVPEQKDYIQNFISEFENVMRSENYNDPDNGYLNYIDLDSFVNFFFINEISRNIDGYRLSTYMYKDKNSKGGKLFMGPVWDFNIAFGNAEYFNGNINEGWNLDYIMENVPSGDYQVPFWWGIIRNDVEFKTKVYEKWQVLRSTKFNTDSILTFIDSAVTILDEAQVRNYEKWDILGEWVWPNSYIGLTYDDEVAYLQSFIINRLNWMDSAIEEYKPESVSVEKDNAFPTEIKLEQNYPNPFNPATRISFSVDKYASVSIKVFSITGQLVRTLINSRFQPGNYIVDFNAADLASGIYFYQLKLHGKTLTRKMVLSK